MSQRLFSVPRHAGCRQARSFSYTPRCCDTLSGPLLNEAALDTNDDALSQQLREVLWAFKAPVRYAFAYGSGVFPQKGYSKAPASKPMVDYIFGVSHAQHFHSLNLTDHRDHYSFLRRFGSGTIAHVQERYGAGVYFNPYVTVNGVAIKYGVVHLDTLCEDLADWRTLYLAGRMQKPVKVLRDHPRVRAAQERNLASALATALLLLPEHFTERELFLTIAKLSYLGDPRMSVGGENPDKVLNIVSAQHGRFETLYAPFLSSLATVQYRGAKAVDDEVAAMAQDWSPAARGALVARLPKSFKAKLYKAYGHVPDTEQGEQENRSTPQASAIDVEIATSSTLSLNLTKAISATVAWPSTVQSIKGIFTAGPLKSWNYVGEKFSKARRKKAIVVPAVAEATKTLANTSTAAAIRDSVRRRSTASSETGKGDQKHETCDRHDCK